MATVESIEALIATVESHKPPHNDRATEIGELDIEVGSILIDRSLAVPHFKMGSYYKPFGQTQIPHYYGTPVINGERVGPAMIFFRATPDWVQVMRALAVAADRAERTPDSKTDGKKNSWPGTPENPDVLKLARLIRKNPDPKRTKTDMAREIANYDETKTQSLLRKLRAFPHLLNGADTADR